jgi:hypothetical protein
MRLLLSCFFLLSLFSSTLFSAEGPWANCQALEAENFNHLSVIACPNFASHGWGRMDLAQARKIKTQESILRKIILEQNIQADIRIKIGVEIVSEEEVWFIPEAGFFYQAPADLAKMQEILPELKQDQLLLYGIFQGYLTFTSPSTSDNPESLTFMGSNEFQLIEEIDRENLRQKMPTFIDRLRNTSSLFEWQTILTTCLLPDHFLDWKLIDQSLAQNFRLSTYFDYQWFSATLPDNSTLASDLVEEFEAEVYHTPSN